MSNAASISSVMPSPQPFHPARYRVYTESKLDRIEPLQRFSEAQRFAMRVVAKVLPFRVNQYVIDHLIDWNDPLNDPLFRLTVPQPEMLAPDHFETIARLLEVTAALIDNTGSNARDAALVGAAVGVTAGALEQQRNKELIVRNCMRQRGYNVVG